MNGKYQTTLTEALMPPEGPQIQKTIISQWYVSQHRQIDTRTIIRYRYKFNVWI